MSAKSNENLFTSFAVPYFIFLCGPSLIFATSIKPPCILSLPTVSLRLIQPSDNPAIARIIREVLTEFRANKPGTVYYDPTTDHLFQLFAHPHSQYWILELDGKIVGGSGVYPTDGLPDGCCELVKLYLLPAARSRGYGKLLIERCISSAITFGFRQLYLETMPELKMAVGLYERCGFRYLNGPLGNTGHFGCDLWMLRAL